MTINSVKIATKELIRRIDERQLETILSEIETASETQHGFEVELDYEISRKNKYALKGMGYKIAYIRTDSDVEHTIISWT